MREGDVAARYRTAAAEIRDGFERFFYHQDLGRYVRMGRRENGGYWHDVTVDSALCGLFLFDFLPLDDERLLRTMTAVEERLWIETTVGGVARYENDYYHQVSQDVERIPGNPWFVCTLWLAEWHARRARTEADLARPCATSTGAACTRGPPASWRSRSIPRPESRSPSRPLTWSHAAYVSAAIAIAKKKAELKQR